MSRKSNLSCRLDPTLLKKLQKLAGETGLTTSDLTREAIALYLREEAPTVGDRLSRVERELENLKRRFRLFSD
jgi:predicted transcriptional regulator